MSPENLPRANLAAEPPRIAWSYPLLSRGFGAPVVDQGRVYILDRDALSGPATNAMINPDEDGRPPREQWSSQPDRKTHLRCLALDDGRQLWNVSWVDEGMCRYDGIRSWPVFNEQFVYVADHNGYLRCFDKQTHRQAWAKLIGSRPVGRTSEGYTKSPILHQAQILAVASEENYEITAFHAASGRELWKTSIPGFRARYLTPSVLSLDGVDQLVTHGDGRYPDKTPVPIYGVAADTGKILWRFADGLSPERAFIPPMPVGTNRVFIGDSSRLSNSGWLLLSVSRKAGGWQVEKPVHDQRGGRAFCQIHQPVARGERLFDWANLTGLCCRGLDGQLIWHKRTPSGAGGAQLMGVGRHLLILSESGALQVLAVKAEGDTFESSLQELCTLQILEDREVYSRMAYSQGRLLARGRNKLVCVDFR